MKYLALFAGVASAMLVLFALSAIVSGITLGAGHVVMSLGIGALVAVLYWLFKHDPPHDGEDLVTRLWRS